MAHVSAAERRPQLIKAAIDLMTREGVAAGSTRAIAAELGVAQATVHYTFGTKEGLYRAVMEKLAAELVSKVEQATPQKAGFEETIGTLAAALWQTVREQPANHQLLSELMMLALRTPSLAEAGQRHYRDVTEAAARILAEAAGRTGQTLAQPAETIARYFLAGFDGLMMQHLSLPDEEAEQICLGALVSAVLALADGRLAPTAIPAKAG
jgi:AcrR family transcriptional regulator